MLLLMLLLLLLLPLLLLPLLLPLLLMPLLLLLRCCCCCLYESYLDVRRKGHAPNPIHSSRPARADSAVSMRRERR